RYLVADSFLAKPRVGEHVVKPGRSVFACPGLGESDVRSDLDAHLAAAAGEPALPRQPRRQQISKPAQRHQTSQASGRSLARTRVAQPAASELAAPSRTSRSRGQAGSASS